MSTLRSVIEIATAPLTRQEVREVVDAALSDQDLKTSDPRLMLAGDMICDAAMEVMTLRSSRPSVEKTLTFGEDETLSLRETGLVSSLWKLFESGGITQEEINSLLLRSATADVIQKQQASGRSDEEICASPIALSPIGFNAWVREQQKPKSWLARLFPT
ncbi:MAG: hypothetical protein AAGD13_19145 [Pseudomonadota bacterium]